MGVPTAGRALCAAGLVVVVSMVLAEDYVRALLVQQYYIPGTVLCTLLYQVPVMYHTGINMCYLLCSTFMSLRKKTMLKSPPLMMSLVLVFDGFGRGHEAHVFFFVMRQGSASTNLPGVKRGEMLSE